jgi:hypothetical protein
LTNNGCSFCEGYLINLLWNRPTIRPTGEFPVGTNKKGVNSAYGDVNLSHIHPGCLNIHSVHTKIGLGEHDKQLEAHNKRQLSDKMPTRRTNHPSRLSQLIPSFLRPRFQVRKIPPSHRNKLRKSLKRNFSRRQWKFYSNQRRKKI